MECISLQGRLWRSGGAAYWRVGLASKTDALSMVHPGPAAYLGCDEAARQGSDSENINLIHIHCLSFIGK